jgi:hypothetical protein
MEENEEILDEKTILLIKSIQKKFRNRSCRKSKKKTKKELSKTYKQRTHIIKEIYSTEKDYIEFLLLLQNVKKNIKKVLF